MKRFFIKRCKTIGFIISSVLPFIMMYALLFFVKGNVNDIPTRSIEGILILLGLLSLMILIVTICINVGDKIKNIKW